MSSSNNGWRRRRYQEIDKDGTIPDLMPLINQKVNKLESFIYVMPKRISQYLSCLYPQELAKRGVNQPAPNHNPSEEGPSMQAGPSEPGMPQRSPLQRNLLAQVPSQPQSKEDYLKVWGAWAKQAGSGEKRKEAVKRMKAWKPGKPLDLSSLRLTSLPLLPGSVQKLNVSWNQLKSVPVLPASLQELDITGNPLTSQPPLPPLPSSLQRFHAAYCQLHSLPEPLCTIVQNGHRIENHPLKSITLQGNSIPEEQIQRLRELIGLNHANDRIAIPPTQHQPVGKSDESGRSHRRR